MMRRAPLWFRNCQLRTQGIIAVVAPLAIVGFVFAAINLLAGTAHVTPPGVLSIGAQPLAAVAVWGAVGLAASLATMVAFTRSLSMRLSVVAENAERLSDHRPLQEIELSGDEIGRLAAGLAQTGRLLAGREQDLREALQAEEKANQAKSDFLSRVSHELRTPLNAVIGFSQLLEMETNLNQGEREAVGHIRHASDHLLDLINELLDIGRIESDLVSVELEPVTASEIMHEAIALVGPLADQHEVTLSCKGLADWPDLCVLADRQRLLQVLLNLLTNAIKYNHTGGLVIGDCHPQDEQARFEVIDNGQGIDLADVDRLFTPFDRLGAEHTAIEGTGIGLSLSQQLVASMNGQLVVDSAVGVGSTFAIDLPSIVPIGTTPSLRWLDGARLEELV